MKVTEHNISEWRLIDVEIDELICMLKKEIKSNSLKERELFLGMILGKLIIMKNGICD